MKKKTTMTVLDSRMLAQDIWSLELAYAPEDLPDEVRPGQFAGLFPAGGEMLLMRPISICRWDRDRGVLRFVYRAAGKGTQSFTALKKGDRMDMLGILGNGYDLNALRGRHVLLLGGGIGVPPMLELAAALHDTDVYIATEDGSAGTKGNVLDAVRENNIQADVVCACGPLPMLRAIKRFAEEQNIPAFLSLEERMACGVGVCLGCVAKTRKVDEHSKVHNARVCVEGPVFPAEDVDLD